MRSTRGLATSLLIGQVLLGTATKRICYGIAGGVPSCATAAGSSIAPAILGVAVFALLVLAPIATSIYLASAQPKPSHHKSSDTLRENPRNDRKGNGKQALTARRP